MTEHEYSILGGFSRAKVGRLLGVVAATLSSLLVLLVLTLVDVAKQFGIAANVPPSVFSLIGAAAIWAGAVAYRHYSTDYVSAEGSVMQS